MLFEFAQSGSWIPAGLLGVVVFLLTYWFLKPRKYNLPPGPRGLPLLGNLLELDTNNLHRQLATWSKTHGPVLSIYMGPNLMIAVNDIESALEVLVKRGTDFATRSSRNAADVFTDGGKDIAIGKYGPTWRLHRKLASKAMRQYMQGLQLERRVHDAVNMASKEMEKEKTPYDPEHHVNFLVTNILCGMCFGQSWTFEDKEFARIVELFQETMDILESILPEDFIPGLKYWPTRKYRRLQELTDDLVHGIIRQKFEAHRDTFERDNIRDFTDSLILARKEAEEEGDEEHLDQLTETHLIQTVSDIFLAGINTSRLTIRYAILHMVAYPDIQAKVQEELDRVLGGKELPCMSDRRNLGYTEAVLHESMRLASVAPTGVPHCSMCDSKIFGFDVPKGTDVIINHWALHHDPAKWEDVDKFVPERYLDEEGKLGPKPESWLPFSAGRRGCLGESVAKPELHLIFASLMYRFKWRLPEGEQADLTPVGGLGSQGPKPHTFIIEKRM